MGMNERLVELEESGRVSIFAKPSVVKANESPGFNKLATWVNQDRSEQICKPRYFTDEIDARGVPLKVMEGGGKLEVFFLEISIWQHLAGCKESKDSEL